MKRQPAVASGEGGSNVSREVGFFDKQPYIHMVGVWDVGAVVLSERYSGCSNSLAGRRVHCLIRRLCSCPVYPAVAGLALRGFTLRMRGFTLRMRG